MTSSSLKSLALSFYTLLSRILGLVRDHYMATSFGNGMVASAFSVAYRFPNMFRNLLAEGTLSQSFMPIFSDYEKIGREDARQMTGVVLSFLFFFLSCIVAVFWVLAGKFLPDLVGGSNEYGKLVVDLSLILFFLIATASLSSIFMSISNSKHNYFVPSLSPIILNLSYLSVFLFAFPIVQNIEKRVYILAYGIVGGGVLQLLVQAWYVGRLGLFPILRLDLNHPALKKIFSLMLPAALGGSFYQLGLLVDIFLANYVQNQDPNIRAVVSLDYAQRLVQLPTGIIGVAIATTILPTLLETKKMGKKEEIPNEIASALTFGLFLTIPASFGLIILGDSVLNAIYLGGRWTLESTAQAVLPLALYSLAIPFYSCNKILISSYYAFQDTKTPLRMQLIAFVMNLVLAICFLGILRHSSIALASAIGSAITTILLIYHLKSHDVRFAFDAFGKRILFLLFPLLGLGIWLFLIGLWRDPARDAWTERGYLLLGIGPGIGIYFFLAYFLKLPEFMGLWNRIQSKIRKRNP